jgi:hypothetical protein
MVLYKCYGASSASDDSISPNALKMFEHLIFSVFVFELFLNAMGFNSQKQHVFWKQAADNFMIFFVADFCNYVSV